MVYSTTSWNIDELQFVVTHSQNAFLMTSPGGVGIPRLLNRRLLHVDGQRDVLVAGHMAVIRAAGHAGAYPAMGSLGWGGIILAKTGLSAGPGP